MSEQCQSCGAFDGLQLCPSCGTAPICGRCRGGHELGCKEAQEKKKRGQGKTVNEVLRSDKIIPPMAGRQSQTPEPERPSTLNPGVNITPFIQAHSPERTKALSQLQTKMEEKLNDATWVTENLPKILGLPVEAEPDVDEINMKIAEAVAEDDGMPPIFSTNENEDRPSDLVEP